MVKRSESRGGVIVAHPGTQHCYETALAVQEAGLLRRFMTGFYHEPHGALSRAIRCLPEALRSGAERELCRRHANGLDPDRIQTIPVPELLYLLACRLSLFKRYADKLLRWRNERFDDLVSEIVECERPPALLCYDSCALKAFRRAKSLGVACIMDQSVAHLTRGLRLLQEEAVLHPDFADSLPAEAPDWLVRRCTEEAILADWILAGSEYVKESLVELGVFPSRIAVVPYGADTDRFHPVEKASGGVFRLLFVGQISQRKGIKYLLEAIKQLNLNGMELVLVGGVVGSGEGLIPYRGYFTHVPNVPHHEVHTYFQRGDVFVYPSLHEGSAIAVYEALASGLPVITTPNSGSVVRDGIDGFIVPIRDVEALKEKILLLYENRELRAAMGRNARRRAEEFTWQAYRQRVGAFLRGVLRGCVGAAA